MLNLKPRIRIECINRDYKHIYKDMDTGIEYPSTTAVTKIIQEDINPLLNWSVRQATDQVSKMLKSKLGKKELIDEKFIREIEETAKSKSYETFNKAGELGSRFHSIVDNFILTGKDPTKIDEDLKVVYLNFKEWLKNSKLKVVLGDTPCINRKEGYAGRPDVIFQDELGNYVLGDWKTSNWINNAAYSMQIASYCAAFADTYGVTMPKKAFVVRFDKVKPIFEVAMLKNVEESYKSFLETFRIKKQLELGVWSSVNKFYGS
jgi:hypothetical protein